MPARPPRRHLPAHQDLEGVTGPRPRRQARPHRARPGALPRQDLRLRRVRATRDPAHQRLGPGRLRPPRTAPRDLPPHPRRAVLPRLLLDRRRHPVGRQPPQERSREHPGRTEVDPRGPARRRPDLRDHGQSVCAQGPKIRLWAKKHRGELCFTPTYASWAHPIEAHFGPLRQFTIANSNHRNHPVQTRALHAYLRWRNANARHRDVLAAERRERARIRSEKGIRWGGRPLPADRRQILKSRTA